MANRAQFLGFDLAIEKNNRVARPNLPGINATEWEVYVADKTLILDRVHLQFANAWRVFVKLRLNMTESGNVLSPTPGYHDNSNSGLGAAFYAVNPKLDPFPSGKNVSLNFGYWLLRESGLPPEAVLADAQGNILLRIAEVARPITRPGDGFPFQLDIPVGGDGGRFRVDLGGAAFEFLAGSTRLITRTPFLLPDTYPDWDPNRLEHVGEGFKVDLMAPVFQRTLKFAGAAQPFPLHVELANRSGPIGKENPICTPVRAYDYNLEVSLAGTALGAERVTAVNLKRASANFRLESFATSNTKNIPIVWDLNSGVDAVPLNVRLGDAARPGTLLIGGLSAGLGVSPRVGATPRLHGEVLNAELVHAGGVTLECASPLLHPAYNSYGRPFDPDSQLEGSIKGEASGPFVAWDAAPALQPNSGLPSLDLRLSRPGRSYRSSAALMTGPGPDIPSYAFKGPQAALPLVPMGHLVSAAGSGGAQWLASTRAQLDGYFRQQEGDIACVRQDTNRSETATSADVLKFSAVFAPVAARPAGPQFDGHHLAHLYGLVQPIEVKRAKNAPPEYVIARVQPGVGDDQVSLPPLKFQIATNDAEITLDLQAGSSAEGTDLLPKAVLKFARDISLAEIAAREGFADGYLEIAGDLPDSVKARGWTGVIFFTVNLKLTPGTVLSLLIPTAVQQKLQFTFVAASPKKDSGGADDGYAVSARLKWNNKCTDGPGAPGEDDEATFQLKSIDGRWENTALQSLEVKAWLIFKHFLGLANSGPADIEIIGAFDRATKTTRFSARADQPVPLLPAENASDGSSPIRQVYFKGATVELVRGYATIVADGHVDAKPFQIPGGNWPYFDVEGARSIDFAGLEIQIPNLDSSAPKWLKIGYPSFRLNLDGPRFNVGPLSFKLNSIGLDFGAGGVPRFNWDNLVKFPGLDLKPSKFPCLILVLRIELMKLPAILASSVERLSFDFTFGTWPDGTGSKWLIEDLCGGISALGFDHLKLDLFRFIQLSIDNVYLHSEDDPSYPGKSISWLDLNNVSLSVLEWTLIKNLYAKIYVRDNQSGFIGYMEGSPEPSLFNIEWGLLGHNIALPPQFAEEVLNFSPANLNTTEPTQVQKRLVDEFAKTQFLPQPASSTASDWMVGAGVSIWGPVFRGRFLYQEGGTVGLALNGEIFRDWFGWDLAIAVLYFKGGHPDEDRFYASITIPKVLFGPVSFMGGAIAIEVFTNGGFTLDIGFPWRRPGSDRDWNRTFGAIVTPFQGSGGFYIRHRNISLPVPSDLAGKVVSLGGGYAVQAGLGAAFGGGIVTVWVRVGLYAIVEGDVFLDGQKLAALRLSGAIGVLLQGHAGLNWWIISVDVDICISAEMQATILWVADASYVRLLPGYSGQPGDLVLNVNVTVHATVSASACIRLGFTKVCRGISVSVPMHVQYDLRLGHP